MSNDPCTLEQSLLFQHDLVIMVHVDLQMLAILLANSIKILANICWGSFLASPVREKA